MERVTKEIMPGFTPGSKIFGHTWKGFGWFGQLQVELDGGFYVMSAGGTCSGDCGDMTFKVFENITQEQADRIRIIAFKTDNPV